VTNTCGGTVTAVAGTTSITLSGANATGTLYGVGYKLIHENTDRLYDCVGG
jgi:hypothetical protein